MKIPLPAERGARDGRGYHHGRTPAPARDLEPLPDPDLDRTTALDLPRCLVPFDPRQVPLYRFDVVVLGSGAAGSCAALAAADRGATVAVLTKGQLDSSNTNWAQGGMAVVLGEGDSVAAHVADTLAVGCDLSEPDVVESVISGGPAAVDQLLALGARFDRAPDGELELSREGGHSHARVIHAHGDATGLEIQRTVSKAILEHPSITTFPETFAIDLLADPEGAVNGVLCLTASGDRVAFHAGQVVLATGGAGQLYRETTNPAIATADGLAMGLRAGASLRDLEFVQFHPTCLYIAGAARVLISEIVRGAGGILRDRHGVRFMLDDHPQAELAPRDVVSRSIFARMVATDDTNVYLDLSALDRDPHEAFPGISRICRFFGIDIARDPIPVRPGAHYMIGGLEVDLDGRTDRPGLWAVGECASTGLHGANRMGSNSLLEAIVLGARTGEAAAHDARARRIAPTPLTTRRPALAQVPKGVQVNIDDLTYSLKSLMWRDMGVQRRGEKLADALDRVAFWMRAVKSLGRENPRSWELANMLLVARLAIVGAQAREESRGVHHRTDFPQPRDGWRCHTTFRPRLDGDTLAGVELERVRVGVPAPQA